MYEPPQKKNSSWTPSTVQKKGKSPSKLGHFSIQPKPNPSSESSQEIGEYSRTSMDRLAANVMRSLQTREQEIAEESIQPKFESPWAPTFEPPPPLPESPASKLKGAFASVSENSIQRQCAECAKEMVEQKKEKRKEIDEIGIQTKLTVGAPGDAYEQEADQVASQVMSMSAPPDSSASVQRQLDTNHPHHPHQIWQRAQSIKPVMQRQIDPRVQMREMIQRAHHIDGNQASGNLESRLNASKGGGSPLSENVRGFMEPRFGADFSGVRVHTGGEAVQMNQELGAQAFTHGSDVYFGQGKEPGNNELTAHELTHVVQQTRATDNLSEQKLHSARNIVSKKAESDSQADRVAKLKANYIASVKQGNWGKAALLLNGFNNSDILSRLKKLSGNQLAQMKRGALNSMPGWSDRITKPIDTLMGKSNSEAARVAQLKADYEAAVKQGNWGKAALHLNGFNNSDILSRLNKLSSDQLLKMKQGALNSMPGWSDRVTKPIDDLTSKLNPEIIRVTQLNVDYEAAVKQENWGKAALHLNGFNDSDILTRLKALSGEQLLKMNQEALNSMPGWSDRVTQPMEPLFEQQGISPKLSYDKEKKLGKKEFKKFKLSAQYKFRFRGKTIGQDSADAPIEAGVLYSKGWGIKKEITIGNIDSKYTAFKSVILNTILPLLSNWNIDEKEPKIMIDYELTTGKVNIGFKLVGHMYFKDLPNFTAPYEAKGILVSANWADIEEDYENIKVLAIDVSGGLGGKIHFKIPGTNQIMHININGILIGSIVPNWKVICTDITKDVIKKTIKETIKKGIKKVATISAGRVAANATMIAIPVAAAALITKGIQQTGKNINASHAASTMGLIMRDEGKAYVKSYLATITGGNATGKGSIKGSCDATTKILEYMDITGKNWQDSRADILQENGDSKKMYAKIMSEYRKQAFEKGVAEFEKKFQDEFGFWEYLGSTWGSRGVFREQLYRILYTDI